MMMDPQVNVLIEVCYQLWREAFFKTATLLVDGLTVIDSNGESGCFSV
jgi:hypothetical protein